MQTLHLARADDGGFSGLIQSYTRVSVFFAQVLRPGRTYWTTSKSADDLAVGVPRGVAKKNIGFGKVVIILALGRATIVRSHLNVSE